MTVNLDTSTGVYDNILSHEVTSKLISDYQFNRKKKFRNTNWQNPGAARSYAWLPERLPFNDAPELIQTVRENLAVAFHDYFSKTSLPLPPGKLELEINKFRVEYEGILEEESIYKKTQSGLILGSTRLKWIVPLSNGSETYLNLPVMAERFKMDRGRLFILPTDFQHNWSIDTDQDSVYMMSGFCNGG